MIAGMQTHLSDLLSRLLSLPHETEWVEFKRNYHNPEDIGQYLSAISNSVALHGQKAGYIVWGIEDQSHSPVGTSFRPRAAKFGNEDLEPWLARNLHPDLNFIIHEFLYKARSIVLFEIPPANYTPVTWKGIAYIRVGSCRKKLRDHSEKERALWNRLSGTIFETGIAASRLTADDVLNVLDYSSFFEMSDQRMPTRKVAILERLTKEKLVTHVCRGHWDLTNLGALLFARKLSDLGTLGRKAVRVIVYRSNDRTATIKEHVSIRGYAAGFEELMNYINDQIPQSEQISGALRREVPLYPSIAVRELLANALIHQDLWLRGVSSTIEIFSDRIEITNPGPPLIDTLRFLDEPPQSRNEALAAFMRRLNICEERGSGIDKVIDAVEAYQLPAPSFLATESHTTAVLLSPRKLTEMKREDKVRACYQHACLRFVCRDVMTNTSLRKRFGIDETNAAIASRIIGDTIEEHLVKPNNPKSTSRKHASYVPFWA